MGDRLAEAAGDVERALRLYQAAAEGLPTYSSYLDPVLADIERLERSPGR